MKSKKLLWIIPLGLVVLAVLAVAYYFFIGRRSNGIPFIKREPIWSIGVYSGPSPIKLSAPQDQANPVVSAKDVTDVDAEFVGDPFIVKEGNTWYLFFEVLDDHTKKGSIGVATSSDTKTWTYQQIVLKESFHLSYPYVFKWEGQYYMVPESSEDQSVRLYRAVDFPTKWVFEKKLLDGDYVDSAVFYYGEKWWLLTASAEWMKGDMLLFYSDQLTGPWQAHPLNPIIKGNESISRLGGRVIEYQGKLIRYTQDSFPYYGRQILAFEIDELTPTTYVEKQLSESSVVAGSGKGWNADGMHQVDAYQIGDQQWIAVVDGFRWKYSFGLGY
jgi:hypothetical protein